VVFESCEDFPNAPEPERFGDQLAWLEQDLKKANSQREKYPWIIVGGHRPMYSTSIVCLYTTTKELFNRRNTNKKSKKEEMT
jgi:hypothetical protein